MVQVVAADGQIVGPLAMPRVELTDAQWRERLTPEQYRILRRAGTEPPFCAPLLDNKQDGVYSCLGCRLPLFSSDTKFDSGTGWPSFFRPVHAGNITELPDNSIPMMPRTEIVCARCDGHLGHVFKDGPRPTGLRYCVNGESLMFTPKEELDRLAEVDIAYFAGGCFWCVEAVFDHIAGVIAVDSGYTGGDGEPNYRQVTTGLTGHAESVRITFDPRVVTKEQLLEVHFATHDPTSLNRQGADIGTHYRSALFYRDEAEKAFFESFISKVEASGEYAKPIVTTVEPFKGFYLAEDYHQDFVETNPDHPYVRAVAVPKVEKTKRLFGDILKSAKQAGKPGAAPESTDP